MASQSLAPHTLESLDYAAHLADGMRSCEAPEPIAPAIPMLPDEQLFAVAGAQVFQYEGQDVHYATGSLFAFGSVKMLAATAGASALYNRHKRKKAERQAAPQWRLSDQGMVYFTSHRLGCQLTQTWYDLDYTTLRGSHCDDGGFTTWIAGAPPLRFAMSSPHWYFVLLRYLAHGEIVDVPRPQAVEADGPAALPAGS